MVSTCLHLDWNVLEWNTILQLTKECFWQQKKTYQLPKLKKNISEYLTNYRKDLLCTIKVSLNNNSYNKQVTEDSGELLQCISFSFFDLNIHSLDCTAVVFSLWEKLQQLCVSKDFQPDFPSITHPPHQTCVCFDHRHVMVS